MKVHSAYHVAATLILLGTLPTAASGATAQCCRASLATPAAPSPAPSDKHMLFRVRSPNGATVFLLGSVHLLSAEAAKLPPAVDSAFERAGTVAFEANFDSLQMRAMELMIRGRYTNGATLRSSLSPAGVARLDTLLHAYGLSVDQVNGYKPWFVSLLLMQTVMQRANFQAQYGVDMQINARAHSAKKLTVGLEPVDAQLGMFDGISTADQERMVLQSSGPDSSSRVLMKIKDAWLTGDVAALDDLLNQGLKDVPSLFAKLVTERNVAWIPKIEELVKSRNDALIVVGAGHLVGKQGLVELLRAKGYTVDQM
jgi:uncharacterized protein YbaP (TraB family)